MSWVFLALAGGFGLLWGSFLNVVIYRLPQTAAAGLPGRGEHSLWYLAYPLSFCPHCKTPIAPWRNIPLLSYLLLAGRSHCCRQPISWRYPLTELAGALIFLLAFFAAATWLDFVLIVIFLSLLLVNAVIDWQRRYLLDILTYPLLWLGLLANIDARFALLPDSVLGAAGGYVALAFFAELFSRILKRRAMGMGDYKLFAALGAWLGWQPLPLLLFFAALTGLVMSALWWVLRFRSRYTPFGPALALAGALMLLAGDRIMLAYWQFILS